MLNDAGISLFEIPCSQFSLPCSRFSANHQLPSAISCGAAPGGVFLMEGEEPVGTCPFVGAPKEGKVEIAYYTLKRFEGRGIASFACAELLRIALEADPGVTVTAKTAPHINASTRILEKNGFMHTGSVEDHEIGEAWGGGGG